eukprot:TRINITY_DN4354_c0_g2_i1.p1 TRINITY_DN4354_c0_g2~~TRINITY_DN4354_c0_g2_i1.p1  ORF type:complete len:162 (-),score=14.37 TRINITY_DN4354_c0_g2_i1:54-512(-)
MKGTALRYLDGVINETLRLFPSVPYESKTCVDGDTLPSGANIPPGAVVNYSPWVLGHLESFWDNVDKVVPERWIENHGYPKPPKHTPPFIPFNYGRRTCLGRNMAYLEIKIAAIMLVQKFRLQVAPNHKVMYHPRITISTKYGMKMIASKRL